MSAITSKRRVGLFTRSIRITSGLVLLAFVTSHLLNASFGIISIKAMEAAHPFLTEIWQSKLAFSLLFLSLIAHFILGLYAIYNRPTLRTNVQDLVQIVTAVLVLPLMAIHTIGIYFLERSNLGASYETTIQSLWIGNPTAGLIQVCLITVVWLHGCAGLITWLRSKESARNLLFWIYPIIVAIPIAALLGYAEAGRSALAEAAKSTASQATSYGSKKDSDNYANPNSYKTPESKVIEYKQDRGSGQGGYAQDKKSDQSQAYGQDSGNTYKPATGYGQASGYGQEAPDAYGDKPSGYGTSKDSLPPFDQDLVIALTSQVIWWSIALAALTFFARFVRLAVKPTQNVDLTFDSKRMGTSRSDLSLLDVLRLNDEPHASLCEGRGRCGTCVVRVLSSDFPLPEPTDLELRTLHAKGFPEGTRLACQLSPSGGHINIEAVFPPDYTFHDEEPDTLIDASEVRA
ncbi:MAG: 2Fe-2S iron-sulfur cluster-binding protein [Paracoccaceae bacterium]